MKEHWILTLGVLLLLIGPLVTQAYVNGVDEIRHLPYNGSDAGLFPVIFNLATRAQITVNATCGEMDRETYCRLVEHVRRRPGESIQCGACDMNSYYDERHPITNAIDGSNKWWQSPTLANGWQYNWVTITLDLGQVYKVAYVIVKAANSPRPGNWVLERSLDGSDYKPWQYYAMSYSQCWRVYGIRATIGIPRYERDDEVKCTSHYSRLDPLLNGEIHTSLLNGRPGVNGPSQLLQDFTSARYVRLRFQKIRTLNADLMTFRSHSLEDLDPTVTNRYYYSIKDISIGGQCICFGHARECPVNPETGKLQCKCEGNTCGGSCDQCCPLFRQKPWKPGTYSEKNECEECNCFGHADECAYNATVAEHHLSLNIYGEYEGGGVCVDCKHNTMGMNCEICADGYYRPQGMDHRRSDSCIPCFCDGIGSTGLCVKDDCLTTEGLCAGDCFCREGYAGPRCDHCAPGFTGYPLCQECPCSRAGSLNLDTCELDCQCKAHTCGTLCDECADGFYNLQFDNPDGCDPCFCFGLSNICTSSIWGRKQMTIMAGWNVTDLLGSAMVAPMEEEDGLSIHMSQTENILDRVIYWLAPTDFLGNMVTAYGGIFEYAFSYSINESYSNHDQSNFILANYDVIIEGDGRRLGYLGSYYNHYSDHLVRFTMTEGEWRHLESSTFEKGALVAREEFMNVLARLEKLMIKATYHIYQTGAKLLKVSLDVAGHDGVGDVMSGVEVCQCPRGYTGTSCEMCDYGYRRVDNVLIDGVCEPCYCNGHSGTCDPYTGECLNCEHNTQGAYCELCDIGYEGDATLGTPDACQMCSCPLNIPGNSFAEGCISDPQYPQHEFICVGCQEGYEGLFCERCSPGYYGDPNIVGGQCLPCQCNGNIDISVVDSCDQVTGECRRCLGDTEGLYCDQCKEGYFGTAVNGDCRECACDRRGSYGDLCDPVTGQCSCQPKYTGLDCGKCEPGYGTIDAGCIPCDCNPDGSGASECDPVTGQCVCREGVGGLHCDVCQSSYYDFTAYGCRPCDCDPFGAVDQICDSVTGECTCRNHTYGMKCSNCEARHWGIESGNGCQPCACNLTGSSSIECDLTSGQCQCQPGITGRTCDQCQPGHWGFSWFGCQECEPCHERGRVCDPRTGECVCPPNTIGDACEQCTPHSWGYDPILGCKSCGCNGTGALDMQCDVYTGDCLCDRKFDGKHCDRCRPGHFDFPNCRPCHCDIAGSDPEFCDAEGNCNCDETGQCFCKENVGRKKCKTCKRDSFSLQAENPAGCTSCFCFGRSFECQQANYVWSTSNLFEDRVLEIKLDRHGVSLRPNSHGLMAIPADINIITVDPSDAQEPLYWSFPTDILGDWTLSYNGQLSFRVESRLGPSRSTAGLVHLVGNSRLHLVYPLPDGIAESKEYTVTFREDLWEDADGSPVSRETVMVALQNIQMLLVLGATQANTHRLWLSDVELMTAVPSRGDLDSGNAALGIEMCECPEEYTGLSCQNPGPGYYREHPENFTTSVEVLDLIGIVKLCECNFHSVSCDPETGFCLDCAHNTTGDQCEICGAGFYGDPTRGTSYDCQQCACPLFNPSNNFSPTCHQINNGDYVCDACLPEYTGEHCQRCAPGYYGTPVMMGEKCSPCGCNPHGTLPGQACDAISGACVCKPGITGRACDQCTDRYALYDGICKSCDEGCPGILMADLDTLYEMTSNYDTSSATLLPWRYLAHQESEVIKLEETLGVVQSGQLDDVKYELEDIEELHRQVSQHLDGMQNITASGYTDQAIDNKNTATADVRMIDDIHIDMRESVRIMEDVASGKIRNESGVGTDINDAVDEAERILRNMRYQNFIERAIAADEALRLAEVEMDMVGEFVLRSTNTSRVKEHAEEVRAKLLELLRSSFNAINQSQTAHIGNRANKELLYELRHLLEELDGALNNLMGDTRNMSRLNDMSSHLLWNESSSNYRALVASRQRLVDELMYPLQERVGLLQQSLPTVKPILDQALLHSEALQRQAAELEDTFTEARLAAEDPLRAAQVYENIIDAIDEADDAAEEAKRAAQQTLDEVGGQSLDLLARSSVARSTGLKTQANAVKDHISDLIEHTNDEIRKGERKLDRVERKYDELVIAIENTTSDASRVARVVNFRMDNLEFNTQLLNNNITRMKEMLEEIEPQLGTVDAEEVEDASEQVVAARQEVDKALNLTEMLSEKVERIERRHMDISHSLEELRNNIQLARQQANTIKVAMKSQGDCVRKYKPVLQPSTTNNIMFHFKTNRTTSNMMLFFLGKQNSVEYLAVEMVNRNIRFTWNLGAGSGSVEHGTRIESADSIGDQTSKWYKVSAERTGNFGKLTVQQLSMDGTPGNGVQVTDQSPAGHNRLDLDDSADMFIGGINDGYRLPSNLVGRHFAGCIGEVTMDGRQIGMFNFREVDGQCSGCGFVPVPVTTVADVYHFVDDAFATMPSLTRFSGRRFFLTMTIKTFWKNQLLFFAHNEEKGDFVSLELINGKVVFHISLDAGAVHKLTSAGRYNTNTWVTIKVTWARETVLLEVGENDDTRESTKGSGDGYLDLENRKLHFAGVPPAIDLTKYKVMSTSFIGCMRNIQVGTAATLLQSLDKGTYTNMQPGCSENAARVAGFPGDGFIELSGEDLLIDGSLSFSFRTNQPDALLLIGTSSDAKKFYSVSLLDGRLAVWFNGGFGVRNMESSSRYNDGALHSVTVNKKSERVQVYADDERVGGFRLPSGGSLIEDIENGGAIYIGGVPSTLDALSVAPTSRYLQGCVSDITINNRMQILDAPRSFWNVDMGRCNIASLIDGLADGTTQPPDGSSESQLTTRPDIEYEVTTFSEGVLTTNPDAESTGYPSFTVTVTLPSTTTMPPPPTSPTPMPTACAAEGMYGYVDDAVAFGDVKHSHAEIIIHRREVNRDFNITLQMRTLYETGLLLFITNEAQTEFMAVQLVEGRFIVSYDDRGITRDIQSQGDLNDGEWHTVQVLKDKKSITLQVDGLPSTRGRITRRVDVIAPLYVGGIPELFPLRAGIISESFKGCVRKFFLNNKHIDVANSKAVMGVRRCYSPFERGIHMDGYGWVVYSPEFDVQDDFHASFDFRTSKENGILFTTSDVYAYPALGLELHEGVLKFRVVDFDQRTYLATSDVCRHCLCNNQWHSVEAIMHNHTLSLKIDDREPEVIPGPPEPLETFSELLIGGLPIYSMPQGAVTNAEFYKGCLRNVHINHEKVRWHQVDRVVDVQISDCPINV